MALEKITSAQGCLVPIPGDDVDTDRIIPARFMKCVTFDGLGPYAFYDVRFHEDGTPKAHPLNEARFEGATLMLVGSNFGCGSSREHAPQSLHKAGFRAFIGLSFAEIFFGNATTLGMPCVTVSEEDHERLAEALEASSDSEAQIDLNALEVRFEGLTVPCALPPSAREALVDGIWDPIALMLDAPGAVEAKLHEAGYRDSAPA
ncbi:MAG: 3-isopropylmalate dehydratase small subunit [Opitutales bacterium]